MEKYLEEVKGAWWSILVIGYALEECEGNTDDEATTKRYPRR